MKSLLPFPSASPRRAWLAALLTPMLLASAAPAARAQSTPAASASPASAAEVQPGAASAAPRSSTAAPNVYVLAKPFTITALGRQRRVRLYLPPSYAHSQRRYPVIYMHDGQNLFDDVTSYAGEWGVDEAMNDLAARTGFEAIVVGIDNGGEHRINELNPWPTQRFGAGEGDAYLAFVVDTVKPYIDAHYRTRPGRASTAVIGSSMGGLISDYAIHKYPQVFGLAGVLSPSYWIAPSIYDFDAAHPLPAGSRVYLYIGGREGDETVPDAERMRALLERTLPRGAAATLHVAPEARHNEAAWRAEFPAVVRWLFRLKG
jgi:predicted alpha/beta superfamily hydrolase